MIYYLMWIILMPYSLMAIDFSLSQIDACYVDSKDKFESNPAIQQDALEYLKNAEKTNNVVRYVFVRHGETPSNARGGLPGSRTSNDPLTEKGITQAIEAGKAIAETGVSIDGFYRSPTLRTEQTLFYLQQQMESDVLPTLDERLHEKYHGRYEQYGSLTEEETELLKQENALVKAKEIRENTGPSKTFLEKFHYSPDPQEIESIGAIYERVSAFFAETSPSSEGRNFLVVSHYGVLKTLFMQDAYRKGYDLDYRIHDLKNCGIVVIEIDEEGPHVKATTGITFTPEKIK